MYLLVKNGCDRLLAFFLLLLFSPIMAVIAILIKCNMKGTFLFKQKRIGKDHRAFTIYKFKTMRDEDNLPDVERITFLGGILRKTSLDELPQLFNILKGEMSFIGPRPLLPEYLDYYTAEEKKRHTVKPGITGWAQINGRNAISWADKFRLDLFYVERCSIKLDCLILLKTVKCLFVHQDVNQTENVPMQRLDEAKHHG